MENQVKDPHLERHGRRFSHSGGWFLLVAIVVAIPGVVLILIDHGWSVGLGIAVLLIAGGVGGVGIALLLSSAFSRWSARHKLFA